MAQRPSRLRRAAHKGGFAAAASSNSSELLLRRALAGGGLRGRRGSSGNSEPEARADERASDAFGVCRQGPMDKTEIESLRERVRCPALLEKEGWKLDRRESTRRALKYRRDADIIIVIHEGRGWFDPLSSAKGDVFSLAEHLGSDGFVAAAKRVANLVGFVPSSPVWRRRPKLVLPESIAARWRSRPRPSSGSPAWRYLTEARMLPAHVVQNAASAGILREGPYGSLWAAHVNRNGIVVGWEERGPAWRGFATGGAKGLFWLGDAKAPRVCITEAAIDAMSLAAIEAGRGATAYVSTGGGWSPATEELICDLANRKVHHVAATDNNRQGEIYADRIRAITKETSTKYGRARPRTDDWNDELKAVVGRLSNLSLATAG